MKLSLRTIRSNMASKVALTLLALGAVAHIDTAGAGNIGRRTGLAEIADIVAAETPELEIEIPTKADLFAAWARTGTALPDPGGPVIAATNPESESDEVLDECDVGAPRGDEGACGGGCGADDESNPSAEDGESEMQGEASDEDSCH